MDLYDRPDHHVYDCGCPLCDPDAHSAHVTLAAVLTAIGWRCAASGDLLVFKDERHVCGAWDFLALNTDLDLVSDGPTGIRVAPRGGIVVRNGGERYERQERMAA